MSVFTELNFDEVALWLRNFAVGELRELKGIAAGITNTNYFVITQQSRYVLTIFEKNTPEELPYFIDLMAHLAKNGVLCPSPVVDTQGQALQVLHGKPALMVTCLAGKDIAIPSLAQVQQVAKTLAQLHLAGQQFKQAGVNQRDAAWRMQSAQQVMPKLSETDKQLLAQELEYQHSLETSALPHGVVHGDLFRDNVLFDGENLSGLIDFYYACDDVLLYDVAIAVNEWCMHHNGADIGTMNADYVATFLVAYQAVRPLSAQEQAMWHAMLRRAALRFWLSRMVDFYYPQDGALTHTKDPNHFKKLLEFYVKEA